MSRAAIESVIAELSKEWELPELTMDENDFVCVQTEDGVFINIDYFEGGDVLSFYTTVAEIPEDGRLDAYDLMLKANTAWEQTAGASLALDGTEALALLTVSMPVGEMDLPTLHQRMQDFAKLAWQWSKRINAVTTTSDETPGADHTGDSPIRV